MSRASQEELLIDYRDFLRNRNLSEWAASHPHAKRTSEFPGLTTQPTQPSKKGSNMRTLKLVQT